MGAYSVANLVRISGANRVQNRLHISVTNLMHILVLCSHFSIVENILSRKIYSLYCQKNTLQFDVVAVLYNKGDDEYDYWRTN